MSANFSQVEQTFLSAKEIEAQRLIRKSMTQELTVGEQTLLATRTKITAEEYKLLAVSGKLNTSQLAYLYGQGRIKAELVEQLVNEKAITAEEQKRILAGRGMLTVLKEQGMALKGMMVSMLKDPFTWITAIASALFEIGSAVSETENMMNSAMESAAQRFTALANTMKELREAGAPENADAYGQRNQTMLGALKILRGTMRR